MANNVSIPRECLFLQIIFSGKKSFFSSSLESCNLFRPTFFFLNKKKYMGTKEKSNAKINFSQTFLLSKLVFCKPCFLLLLLSLYRERERYFSNRSLQKLSDTHYILTLTSYLIVFSLILCSSVIAKKMLHNWNT